MAALRLSSSSTSGIESYIRRLTDDASISLAQKNDCLKTLAVVLANLIDPAKGAAPGAAGLKYRTLKLDNPKLQARLFCGGSNGDGGGRCVARVILEDRSLVGMAVQQHESSNDSVLVLEQAPSPSVVETVSATVLPALVAARASMSEQLLQQQQQQQLEQRTKKAKLGGESNNSAKPPALQPPPQQQPPQLSEKQKANRLRDEAERLEKEKDRLHRQQTRAKIRADKHVREHDENWKPSVSAAANKTGDGLQSFRDRHGE